MADLLGDLRRTHTCGALRPADIGHEAVLLGWVHRVRDLGSLVFVDVRDRYGVTQVVVRDDAGLLERAQGLRTEHVVAVIGLVEPRSADTVNPKLGTGEVEVLAREIRVLSEARRPPFQIAEDAPVNEEMRLRYRYLDLRKERMQRNLILRHRVALAVRRYFDSQGFLEIETPILGKSTPEGARDFLVPSRVHPGEFFALPQSPQLFKQILMISGLDRYFQIVKCFRDEDLRADRQPEFTQVDVEISFATEDLVFELVEPCIAAIFAEIGVEVPRPFPRMSYAEAMARYGSDKPDLRFGLPIVELSEAARASSFTPFKAALESEGVVRGLVVPGGAAWSRREVDELGEQAKQFGAAGLVWVRRSPEGALQSSALKAIGEPVAAALLEAAGAGPQDLLVIGAGRPDATSKWLGQMRLGFAKRLGLMKADEFAFTWVVDFPLLEWDPEEERYVSMHHPFTSPVDEDLGKMETAPGEVRAKAYDLVLNGSEIGGGSIRIHDTQLQARIFQLLKLSDEEARTRFGFFLEALQYGTPPHGGIALGLDRITAILAGESSIREVIAFPKTAAATDLMTGAPSTVDPRQLKELSLRTDALTPRQGA
ncbi:MAG: aspartate--tRNA ligase [Vicinamibacterales bacterium]|nr:aspartate--tRNA ligase [Vicinamibacterales bacterium]